jgi:hypothetical protein
MHLPLHAYVMGAVSGATRHCEGAGTLGARTPAHELVLKMKGRKGGGGRASV